MASGITLSLHINKINFHLVSFILLQALIEEKRTLKLAGTREIGHTATTSNSLQDYQTFAVDLDPDTVDETFPSARFGSALGRTHSPITVGARPASTIYGNGRLGGKHISVGLLTQ